MDVIIRSNPSFSLCGLNCCLCPRFNTEGASRCPGCCGNGFASLHPACSVITCSKKHNNIEYCFECSGYPCERYKSDSEYDSFITYKNVKKNLKEAQLSIDDYMKDLEKRYSYLKYYWEIITMEDQKGCTASRLISSR